MRRKMLAASLLSLCSLAETSADIRVANGATLTVNGQLSSLGFVQVLSGGTLAGGGIVAASSLSVENGAVVSPGASVGPLLVDTGMLLEGTFNHEISGVDSDQLQVSGNLDISGTTLATNVIVGGSSPSAFIIASYGSLSGGSFAAYSGLPSGYTIDYAYFDGGGSNNIALVQAPVAYVDWATANGLTLGVNDGFNDDPNGDNDTNIKHFALDSDPLGLTGIQGKQREAVHDVGADRYFTLTIPVRSGAVFSGVGSNPNLVVDGIVYTVHGDTDLTAPSPLIVNEISPALSVDLPALSLGYEYRTFGLQDPLSLEPRAFLIIEFSPVP